MEILKEFLLSFKKHILPEENFSLKYNSLRVYNFINNFEKSENYKLLKLKKNEKEFEHYEFLTINITSVQNKRLKKSNS